MATAHMMNSLTHHVSSELYQRKASCLRDRLGEAIASEDLSVLDDPLYKGTVGTKSFDDEGVPTRRLPLIAKGVFVNLLYDTFFASRDGVESTGNGLRGWGMHIARMSPLGRGYNLPTPTPNNVLMEPGDWEQDEIVRETKRGIIIGRFWGGAVRSVASGEFSTASHKAEVQLVVDGKIKHPLRMVRITDSVPRMLKAINAISNRVQHVHTWLPSISHIAPTIRISKVKTIPT